jgi:hypothetical protein
VALAVLAPAFPDFLHALGRETSNASYLKTLALSAFFASVAMLFSQPKWLVVVALIGELFLFRASHFFTDQNLELSALHLAWIGALVGFEKLADAPPDEPAPYPIERSYWSHDLALALIGVVFAAVVGTVVLEGRCDSADEWAYTFQAALYAKLRAYEVQPPCYEAFRAFWVFEHDGRVFSQYLPGWSIFMAPFLALRLLWLAGPASLAILVIGFARLARRAAAATIDAHAEGAARHVRIAGTVAGMTTILSTMMLLNGGSRFPHIFVCAMWAWCVEALCMIGSPLAPNRQLTWGLVLGSATAMLLATRHIDGCLLGVPMAFYFVYALWRRRIASRAIVGAALGFFFWGGLTLILLRLELGRWFATGYSLTEIIHPWNKFKMSVPKPHEWRWGIPLGTGAYCWWPLAPSIGFAGMLALGRTRERRIPFMLCLGVIPYLAFYTAIEYGRGWDFGYGPRYQMVVVAPMAIGAGVVLGPLFCAALGRVTRTITLFEGGPAAVAAAAALLGVLRIAPLMYPYSHDDIKARNVVFDAITRDHLSNAVVWLEKGATISDWLDLPQNMPLGLYDDSVFVLRDLSPEMRQCVREHFPGRRYYHTQGGRELKLVPE